MGGVGRGWSGGLELRGCGVECGWSFRGGGVEVGVRVGVQGGVRAGVEGVWSGVWVEFEGGGVEGGVRVGVEGGVRVGVEGGCGWGLQGLRVEERGSTRGWATSKGRLQGLRVGIGRGDGRCEWASAREAAGGAVGGGSWQRGLWVGVGGVGGLWGTTGRGGSRDRMVGG
ncbi:hypothetical protein KP509_22G013100 [Ceratopteris richardii]|uniref:Uncharacterized protein n=1 Tax=Ceratopteris richardii TaxID=49495 RepID=A0A8T2S4V3_CERRI|nr:hypothetical protein KP509_22G013100 [Ceratopteris richardii]